MSGGVEKKLKRHLVIEFRLIKSIGDNFEVIAIVVRLSTNSNTVISSKESAITTASCANGWYVTVSHVWIQ